MEGLLLRMLTLSLTTSAVLLPLLVFLPRLRHRYAPRSCYVLWLVLALRLLLPFELPNPRPVIRVAPPDYRVPVPVSRTVQTVPATPAVRPDLGGSPQSAAQESTAQERAARETEPPPASLPLTALLSGIWLAGALGVLAWQAGRYLLARRALLRAACPAPPAALAALEEQRRALSLPAVPLLCSDRVDTPLMLGLLRPVILLPAGGQEGEGLALALRHELLHLRRHDVAYKGLMLVCAAVHWFNPLVWWMGREAGRNLERCCDQAVLRGGDPAQRRRYAELLLRSARTEGTIPFSTRFGGAKGQMKERLYGLFHAGKPGRILVAACLAAALLAGGLVACEGTGTGRISEEEAMDRLEESVRYEDGTLSFTVPGQETPSHPWVIRIYGRMEMGPDSHMSVHYMDNVDWTPGETYTQPISPQEAAAMTQLSMDITLGQKERTVDLLPCLGGGAGSPDRPTIPEDAALGTEGLYDFTFAQRYDERVSGSFALTFPDSAIATGAPDNTLSLLARYTPAAGAAEEAARSGDGLVPHQYRDYRYDFDGYGSLWVGTDYYQPDGLEFISYLRTDIPCAFTGTGVGIGSAESEVLLAYPDSLYCLEADNGLDPALGYDFAYFWQPFTQENNDLRDITFYFRDGVVAAIEMAEPYELRYVYGYDREAGLARADTARAALREGSPDYDTRSSPLTLSLAEGEHVTPTPLANMEPDVVSSDTMGEVLVDKTLSGGARIVCYWAPGSEYTKYWAIRTGDTLLRFCEEYSAFAGGYDVTEYTNVLGHDGFRIEGFRGAAYYAYDYYYLDDAGRPRLLIDSASEVIEADFNGDGTRELIWFYHGNNEAYYGFRRDGAMYRASLIRMLEEAFPQWERIVIPDIGSEIYSDLQLRCSYVRDGETHTAAIAFLPDALQVERVS